MPQDVPWHELTIDQVARRLETDASRGLAPAAASARLLQAGPNRLPTAAVPTAWTLVRRQIESPLVLVLMAALVVSAALTDWLDAAAIAAIVVLNATLGFVQEHRAERALAALQRLTVPRTRVVRDGERQEIPADDVVPGDVIALDAGDSVPADARLVAAIQLRMDEAPLTGESSPVHKTATPVVAAAMADRRSMLYLGTHVTAGRALAIVVATGASTELGRIARLIGEAGREPTPLQRRLARLGHLLMILSMAIVGVVFVLGVLRGGSIPEMLLTAVSLAVAAIPEGLPAIVTIALALGVSRMAKRHALVRRLPAVETLGAATVICTDKTGTLTLGEMTVTDLLVGRTVVHVSGEGYQPAGRFTVADRPTGEIPAGVPTLLRAGVLASDAALVQGEQGWRILGDTTEGAIVVAAAKAGLQRETLELAAPRVWEIPFDATRKRMTIVRQDPEGLMAYVKGAPDVLLPLCRFVAMEDGEVRPLDAGIAQRLTEAGAAFASRALRVLAVARKPVDAPTPDDPDRAEQQLTWLGLVAMADAPRPEAAAAVGECAAAGIRTVMITGDHRETGVAVASTLGLLAPGDDVLTGATLDGMDDAVLEARVAQVAVYARVSAEHKLRIVRAWKRRGAIVAMTGDGVNDAPALKEADIGVAMGRTGTAVARESADLVVTDDNFASIVAAVAEGRGIYENIRKAVLYLLSCNLSEVLTMLIAVAAGWPLPLLPLQILWLNLVTDSLPALALGLEPPEPGLMQRPPRDPREPLIDRGRLRTAGRQALFMAAGALVLFALARGPLGLDLDRSRALAFTGLVFSQLAHALNSRSERLSLLVLGPLTNPALLGGVGLAVALQVLITVVPLTAAIFHVAPMSVVEWLLATGAGLLPLAGMETEKALKRRRGL